MQRQLKVKIKEAPLILSFIVESFIKITKYFTKGAFTDLLRRQKQIKNLNKQYFEGKDLNDAFIKLANNKNHEFIKK